MDRLAGVQCRQAQLLVSPHIRRHIEGASCTQRRTHGCACTDWWPAGQHIQQVSQWTPFLQFWGVCGPILQVSQDASIAKSEIYKIFATCCESVQLASHLLAVAMHTCTVFLLSLLFRGGTRVQHTYTVYRNQLKRRTGQLLRSHMTNTVSRTSS